MLFQRLCQPLIHTMLVIVVAGGSDYEEEDFEHQQCRWPAVLLASGFWTMDEKQMKRGSEGRPREKDNEARETNFEILKYTLEYRIVHAAFSPRASSFLLVVHFSCWVARFRKSLLVLA